jgi:hypothetical protein
MSENRTVFLIVLCENIVVFIITKPVGSILPYTLAFSQLVSSSVRPSGKRVSTHRIHLMDLRDKLQEKLRREKLH